MTSYSSHVGVKFKKNGDARYFPGNTIICHVPKDSNTFQYLIKLQNRLKKQSWAENFSFLPPSSFHMTVFEGVCDQVRKKSHWTKKLPLDAPLPKVDTLLENVWEKIKEKRKNFSFSLNASHLSLGTVITLRLKPTDKENKKKLRDFRDLLAKETGIKQPNHNRYGFHISFAYLITRPSISDSLKMLYFMLKSKKEIQNKFKTLKTNPPELTFFKDMTNFAHSREVARKNVKK